MYTLTVTVGYPSDSLALVSTLPLG